ncbi:MULTISPECIES: LysE family translocator [Dickeya]|uniref:LysE family translocator n=1 Tax=Dickeya oryzae TaxID=1240404 RepID=A0AB39I8Y3_9GAMM|nr:MULTISPECIES: LysE family translocator [Dickeya]QYM94932.1 LysE family translocator [Dickeya zeae]MBP2851443.1 LysE family translocator [Dickeya oryzae]MBP2859936.1 LysE family translocator [Dickeya oryzae]MCA6992783.1 LysE family translocator [Dickeya oryzae]MCA6996806.1 LysE family translocator [Dickeya oryzae]
MVSVSQWLPFAAIALGLVLTPGPNMIYLLSRTVCQGRRAGLVSLSGVALGFLFYMTAAALGITAIVMAVPLAYDALRIAGALYLLWLAWQAIRGGASPFQLRQLKPDSNRRLFVMGLVTNLLNPKAAVLYLSLLPQFIRPEQGNVLGQSLTLGITQIFISMTVNASLIMVAGYIAAFLAERPLWQRVQRWLMGTVLAGLAVRMLVDSRR